MGKASRDKGAEGERQIVRLAKECGFAAQRTAPLQAGGAGADVTLREFPYLHIEVKRSESLSVPSMVKQAERDSKGGTPVVFWRRNRMGWRADVPLTLLFELLTDRLDYYEVCDALAEAEQANG